MRLFYYGATLTMKALLLLLSQWEVRGRENVPRKGPLIVVSNHLNLIDPPLLSASIPRRIRFMAKKELFQPSPGRPFIKWFGAFPVRRGELNVEAVRHALSLLEQGQAVGSFPEGRRSLTRQLQRPYPGATLVAVHSGAPILPVAITGTEKLISPASVLLRPRIRVTIGQPFTLPQPQGPVGKQRLAELSNVIMQQIARLLPEKYQGTYREVDQCPA